MAQSSVTLPKKTDGNDPVAPRSSVSGRMDKGPGKVGMILFGLALIGGLGYAAGQIIHDLASSPQPTVWPYVLLGLALVIALGFEFVNGFHDTANAVATVIYTNALEPHIAVVWSGMWNLIGVLTSSGGVAYTIVSLLPVELILQVGSGAGFAMIFALLIAAIIWNLSTWWFGLPVSSSHTLIGSIIGVGVANQLMNGKSGLSGVDWTTAAGVFKALILSPIVGFGFAALLLLVLKAVIKKPELYKAPEGDEPPPFWIRCLLILTCTGVSFGHGSNDGQKGMGLIMLILIGTVPTAYALNHAVGYSQVQTFSAISEQAQRVLAAHTGQPPTPQAPPAPQTPTAQQPPALSATPKAPQVTAPKDSGSFGLIGYVRDKQFSPQVMTGMEQMSAQIEQELTEYKSLAKVPSNQQRNVRNDMYLQSEALRVMSKDPTVKFSAPEKAALVNYKAQLDKATKFIPTWVKVAVALALGLGTMVGWKRIVITVGEKIGKTHLTYAQGASAEIVAAITIIAADQFKLPVSTTHVLSSAVAGTMMANGSGLQMSTIRNILLAWVVTLPAAAVLGGALFWGIRLFVH
jgi:PiT family inorganic phosphate transporter